MNGSDVRCFTGSARGIQVPKWDHGMSLGIIPGREGFSCWLVRRVLTIYAWLIFGICRSSFGTPSIIIYPIFNEANILPYEPPGPTNPSFLGRSTVVTITSSSPVFGYRCRFVRSICVCYCSRRPNELPSSTRSNTIGALDTTSNDRQRKKTGRPNPRSCLLPEAGKKK